MSCCNEKKHLLRKPLPSTSTALTSTGFDITPHLHPDDAWPKCEGLPMERVVECYAHKYAVAARLQPRSILEIGVRAGYSARAFLAACPSADFHGIDLDNGGWGGIKGYSRWAATNLQRDYPRAVFTFTDSQAMTELPRRYDLAHIDGDHSYNGASHDLDLCGRFATWILIDDVDFLPDVGRVVADYLDRTGFPAERYATLRGDVLIHCHQ